MFVTVFKIYSWRTFYVTWEMIEMTYDLSTSGCLSCHGSREIDHSGISSQSRQSRRIVSLSGLLLSFERKTLLGHSPVSEKKQISKCAHFNQNLFHEFSVKNKTFQLKVWANKNIQSKVEKNMYTSIFG